MKPTVSVIPLAAALAIGGGVGFWSGRMPRLVESGAVPNVAVAVAAVNEGTNPAAARPGSITLSPGTLVPVTFTELDRELSLLATLDLAARSERVHDLARAAALADPPAVLSLAEAKLPPVELDEFRLVVVARWAMTDALGAIQWARQQPASVRERFLNSAVQTWARRDAAAALDYVAKVPELELRRSLRLAAFTGVAERDAEAAWLLVEKFPNRTERADLTHAVLLAMVRRDASRALQLAVETGGADRYGALTQQVLSGWLELDPKRAGEWLRQLPGGPQRSQLVAAMTGELARVQPELAVDLARSLPAGAGRNQAILDGFNQWARSDNDSLLRWAGAAQDPAILRLARSAAIEYWAGADPKKAAAMLTTSGLGTGDRDNAIGQIARQWAQRDSSEALTWAQSLPPGQQLESIPFILSQRAIANPKSAVEEAEQLADARLRRRSLQTVVTEWAGRDGSAAGTWLMGQADHRLVAELAPGILQQLGETDRPAAEALLNRLPNGEARVNAVAAMVAGLANSNLRDALGVLERLPPGEAQEQALERLSGIWVQQDPEAAAKYALTHPGTDGRARL